jgi:glutamate/aspartate transport system substrate-binding protein
VQTGTTTEGTIKKLIGANDTQIVPVHGSDEGVALVESGKADPNASDEIVLVGIATASMTPKDLRLSGQLYSYEPYAFMVRKNNAAFRLIADRTLAGIYQSDDILKIWQQWFGQWSPKPPPVVKLTYAIEALQP